MTVVALNRTIEHKTAEPDGPPKRPLLGHLPAIKRDALGFFVNAAATYGDVIPIQMGPERVLMVNNPWLVRHVLQDNLANYPKSKFYEKIRPILGDGIFLSNGDEWLRQRRDLNPGFQGAEIKAMTQQMIEATGDMLARWDEAAARDGEIDISREMMMLTLDIVFRTLLNVDLGEGRETVYRSLEGVLREAERRVWALTPLGEHLPSKRNRDFRAGLDELDAVVYEIIRRRRADPNPPHDLLSMLLEVYADYGENSRSNKMLRDQIMSIVIAGHETTANVLTWMWYLLSRSPAVEAQMREETDRVLSGRVPAFEDIRALPYTTMVFKEAMRLYPPVWTFSRTAMAEDRLGSVTVPKGGTVMLCAYALHRNPRFWENPEGFDPTRFTPDRERERDPFAYFPFSLGPRSCLGKHFGQIEGVLIAAMVTQRYRLDLVPGQDIRAEPMITLRPHGAIRMQLRPQNRPVALAARAAAR